MHWKSAPGCSVSCVDGKCSGPCYVWWGAWLEAAQDRPSQDQKWASLGPKVAQNRSTFDPKSIKFWSKNWSNLVQKWSEIDPKLGQNLSKIGSKIVQIRSKSCQKSVQKWTRIPSKVVQKFVKSGSENHHKAIPSTYMGRFSAINFGRLYIVCLCFWKFSGIVTRPCWRTDDFWGDFWSKVGGQWSQILSRNGVRIPESRRPHRGIRPS